MRTIEDDKKMRELAIAFYQGAGLSREAAIELIETNLEEEGVYICASDRDQ